MNRAFVAVMIGLVIHNAFSLAASRDAQWKEVEEAVNKGLPKTAVQKLEPVIQAALKDKAWGEATKAIARKIVLEGIIQGNKPEEKITRLEAAIAKAPKEVVPLLDTILANWYWQYFQNNRWRFMQRTQTAQPSGNDFATWDLPRLFAEIDIQFQKALANADSLKKTPISAFDDLLVKGTSPDNYRPTLYDFIAREALNFYSSGEQAAAKPEDAFELPAGSPIFDSSEKFIAWKVGPASPPPRGQVGNLPEPGDDPIAKAIRLHQELLKFHRSDKDPSAFLDADIARLAYGYNAASGEERNARYKAALKALVDAWADHELSTLALHNWARVLQSDEDLVEARNLALRGATVFPNSPGGKLCRNLVSEIEAKSLAVTTERVWNCGSKAGNLPARPSNAEGRQDACPALLIRYRNVTNVYFRAVAYDWNVFLEKNHSRPEYLNEADRKELLAKTATFVWSAKLPATPDFKERVEELPAPNQLQAGFYFLISSHRPDFSDQDNQVSYTDIWVSDLALVLRPRDGSIEGFVLEANSGEPVAEAEVAAWRLDNQGQRITRSPLSTDENGFFSFQASQGQNHLFRVRHHGRELATQQDYSAYDYERPRAFDQTIFFTDRVLYRPGQIIQYKGICLHVNQEKDNYEVLARRAVTVVLVDPNGKNVAEMRHQCNDYGSFSGSFTAPRDRSLGRYRIQVSAGPPGESGFNLEEYKRPKFQSSLDPPATAGKLNEKIALGGHAMSYTGAPIDGAKVVYRVVRDVRWPDWWGWYSWRQPQIQASQEIAHGFAVTESDGSFKIQFLAKADPKVSERDEASFSFSVYADVTDAAGETRSAQRGVNIGFTALRATLAVAEWQTVERPVELTIRTTTLDDSPQTAEGSVRIHRLKEPAQVQRQSLAGTGYWGYQTKGEKEDLSNPNNWPLGEVVEERGFTTDAKGEATISFKLGIGAYRAMLETQDRFGKKVATRLPLQVIEPGDTKLAIKIPQLLAAPAWAVEPGEEFAAVWGTGYDTGRAFIELEHRRQMIKRYWTNPGRTQQQIKQAVTEAMRGGFTLHVTRVRENRAYLESRHIEVPWSNKDLEIKWEHFTSKLEPGRKETWTTVIGSRDSKSGTGELGKNSPLQKTDHQLPITNRQPITYAERSVAEMVATLYDRSLDQFMAHSWPQQFSFFRQDHSTANAFFENTAKQFQWIKGQWEQSYQSVDLRYREFPPDLVANYRGYEFEKNEFRGLERKQFGLGVTDTARRDLKLGVPVVVTGSLIPSAMEAEAKNGTALFSADKRRGEGGAAAPAKAPDFSQVTARKNLSETAFFFPQLVAESNGVVRMTFTMPEALTEWKFMSFTHDQACRSGYLEAKIVTAKEVMVQPNPPRFLREGDLTEFTVKVSNQTTNRQTGKVRLTFDQALPSESGPSVPPASVTKGQAGRAPHLEGTPTDNLLGNTSPNLAFDIPARESRTYSWRIHVPDSIGFLTYKAVGSTGKISDGEEGYLPVLSRRILVTESLPLPVRGPATKKFEFAKLLQSGKSDTLRHQSLTVQMVSNPAWYAVMALPYLMEYPHECTEQTFNRFYANALARFIANSDPKIHRVFEQWRNTPALDSPLERNPELKSVALEETPWLRQAGNESQARRNVGILFDDNRFEYETEHLLQALARMQLPDGSWPWFPGGRGNDYITLYITTGFGRLRNLGVEVKMDPAIRALNRLDQWVDETYREILAHGHKEDNHLTPTIALYLYGRSFFLKDQPLAAPRKEAVDYFLALARKYWLDLAHRQSQAHLALALNRFNALNAFNDSTPRDIMKSIKERSVTNEELGMFWRETELSWWWYRAPIETQALMIEAFDEVMGDKPAVEECKVWLLKQKQTQDWKTTKATADAVYGLLLRGRNLLASDQPVEVNLGGNDILAAPGRSNPNSEIGNRKSEIEPGTGFFEHRFAGPEIQPKLGRITVKKADDGVGWGSVHWQYLEVMGKVTAYEGTPLKLKKVIFTRVNTKKGPVLEPVKGPLAVGNELVVRIELRVDRDMEFVHLKDQRGSGTEPVNVISQYKYQDGLAYYESTRDTASHFFIDYLPKGTYVFEYSTRVQLRGEYRTGIAEIQCMYAPEFNSHSESINLAVR